MAEDFKPSLGRIVKYRDEHGVDRAAIITWTATERDASSGVATRALTSVRHVHLQVFVPTALQSSFPEFDVPYFDGHDVGIEPGTWRWPERV